MDNKQFNTDGHDKRKESEQPKHSVDITVDNDVKRLLEETYQRYREIVITSNHLLA